MMQTMSDPYRGTDHPEFPIDANACTCHEQVMILRTGHHDRACPSFRPARKTAHKVSCAGCDCEPGTTCDTKKRCRYCGQNKTTCDAFRSDPKDSNPCCPSCDHRG